MARLLLVEVSRWDNTERMAMMSASMCAVLAGGVEGDEDDGLLRPAQLAADGGAGAGGGGRRRRSRAVAGDEVTSRLGEGDFAAAEPSRVKATRRRRSG